MKGWSIFYIVTILFLGSCAIQSTPRGGPEDNTPPLVIEEHPKSEKIWFAEKEIIIRFNEFVSLKNPNQQILISPPLDDNPDVKLKGKTLIIKINSELQDSTTYTMQFGNAIADITKGNVLKNYKYVFSTGAEIDSLRISGKVINAYTTEEEDDIKVVLYEVGADSGIYKSKPRYFARTNKSGDYLFQNLRVGNYLLYAIDDQNNNYFYNQGERVAFYGDPIKLEKDTNGFNLRLFVSQQEEIKLLGYQGTIPGRSFFNYNKALNKVQISVLNNPDSFFYSVSSEKDSVFAWVNQNEIDTSIFIISADNGKIDTATVRYKNKKESNFPALEIKRNDNYFGISRTISIKSNEPIINIDTSRIVIYEDTVIVTEMFNFSRNKENPLLLNISNDFNKGKIYRFYINKDVLTGISGRKNDSLMMNFILRNEKDLGSIAIKINTTFIHPETNIIVELLNSKKKVSRREIITGGKESGLLFSELIPGNYSFRLVVDKNKNERWDSGNFELRIMPEPVYYFNQKIELKANWEILDLMFTIPEDY